MEIITKSPNFNDQILEISVGQVIYFPYTNRKGIRSMISGLIKTAYPGRKFKSRTIESPTNTPNVFEKVLSVKRTA